MDRASRWGALAFALFALTPRASADDGACVLVRDGYGPEGRVPIQAETVVSGLEVPWAIGFLPNGDMLVTERPGRIRLIHEGKLLPDPVATVGVSQRAESGLLGLAVDPDFKSNRAIYIYLTAEGRGGPVNRVERWTLDAAQRRATRDTVVLDGIPAAQYHDGGRLRFGPDGSLYIGTGDAREPELAQDPRSLAGKILRLSRGGAASGAASATPFVSGVRNVQAFDWDAKGRLYIADHGPSGERLRSGHDRVMHARQGDNLGWPTIYGCQTKAGFAPTALSWEDAVPPGGAAFYTGDAIPEWKGDFIVATLGSKHLHRVRFDASLPTRVREHDVSLEGDSPDGLGRLRDVVMGPDGQLYVTTSNCDGRGTCPPDKDRIVRIRPGAAARVDRP
jgi:glucose/arabinose dehydrogenase